MCDQLFFSRQVSWIDPEDTVLSSLEAYIAEMLIVEKGETLVELGADNNQGVCEEDSSLNEIGRLFDCLIGNRLFKWLIDWLIEWMIDWLIDWLIGWLVGPLIDWLFDEFFYMQTWSNKLMEVNVLFI